jgi:cysteine desulfurase
MANHGDECELVFLTPDGVGRIDAAAVAAALRTRPGRAGLVTVAAVNNEIGTAQDLTAIGAAVAAANATRSAAHRVWFHTDAVQAPGHVPIDLDGAHRTVDFMSLSAHKFHGPHGSGLLFCRTPGVLRPRTYGGSQQGGLRPGTEAVATLLQTAAALADATDPDKLARRTAHYRALSALVWETVLFPAIVSGSVLPTGSTVPGERAPNHVSFCVRGAHRNDIVRRMEEAGVAVSGGSACNATADLPSHVLVALAVPPEFLHGSVRITFGHTNTIEEVRDVVCPALRAILLRPSSSN